MAKNETKSTNNTEGQLIEHHVDPTGSETPESDDDEIEILLDFKKFGILVLLLFFIFPLLPLGLATIFGALFVLCEPDTTFEQGFLYVVSNLLGMANPLTDYSPSGVAVGIVLDIYVAVTALVCFGILLNIVNLFDVPKGINRMIRKCIKNAILVPLIALGVIIPIVNAALCSAFGALLALAEDWTIRDGILYVASNSLGLGTPLTDVTPSNTGGAIIDVIISSMALGYIAIFADYVTVLNPSAYIRRKMRSCLGALRIIDLKSTPSQHPLAIPSYCDKVPDETARKIELERGNLPRSPSQDDTIG